MNFNIGEVGGEIIVAGFDFTKFSKVGSAVINQKNCNSDYTNDPAWKKLVGYARKRKIGVHELINLEGVEKIINQSNTYITAWFYFDSKERKIVIMHLVPDNARICVLLHMLCLEEVFNKYWYLFYGDEQGREEFNSKANKLISKVTKMVARTKENAA